jgi:alkylhydroperoxidase family enzyme
VTQQGLNEDFYKHVSAAHEASEFSAQERLAVEFAERFAIDHTNIDDAFFATLRAEFSDPEILDLTICLAHFLGLGRLLRVLGIDETGALDVGRSDSDAGEGQGVENSGQ